MDNESHKSILSKFTQLSIVVAVLLVSFSVFYYYVIFIPKKEQAKVIQQQSEQTAKMLQEKDEQEAKEFRENQAYKSQRKKDCYEIETKERKQWNNVDGSSYNEETDTCVVRYKTDQYKGEDCKQYENSSSYFECVLGITTEEY